MNRDSNTATPLPLGIDVIRRAQQGDSEAFADLFHAHKSRIYSLCLRMTNNATEAEDLVQDSFVHVFRKLSTFRGDSALSTWVYRIAVNTVLMHFRKNLRKKVRFMVSQEELYRDHDGVKRIRRECGSLDGRLENAVTRLSLARAISELPAGYRMIFLLHEVEGYEHHEIAELLGCSVGNSKSQLHKAKQQIRKQLIRTETRRRVASLIRKKQPTIAAEASFNPIPNLVGLTTDAERPAQASFCPIYGFDPMERVADHRYSPIERT